MKIKDQKLTKIIDGNEKTNLHPLLCLKKFYYDEGRPLFTSFNLKDISSIWVEISKINPAFLDSGYAPDYIRRFSGGILTQKSKDEFFINKNFRKDFNKIDWMSLINKLKKLTPPLLAIYYNLKLIKNYDSVINLFESNIIITEKKLSPFLLEIFAYSVIKVHLWFYGADQNLHRYTKTNANDGGVDIACGDVIYCITTNLSINKVQSDAKKQVKDRLTFITINNKINEEKLKNIIEEEKITIDILELTNLTNMAQDFNNKQKKLLRKTLLNELEKELKNYFILSKRKNSTR